ncbi:hypothetical protein [Winogradskya humida]|uniref:Uncharacterized protein n=1 Tax=Winogradskya humida TaxID=113566 RepID=A0ABQ3ZTN0_9ACTN|nr:hypothetical protein [Actinoplanes humidus]GIE21898.1 hypothetical protein Ahu01nite_050000 [Actinoplanes humidus]
MRVDAEIMGASLVEDATDLKPGEFVTGGEAWVAYRSGGLDASQYGVPGTENWGPAEIRGNAVRDLACLNKVETLPWDEWGRMQASYRGETGADYDELLDAVAEACAADDPAAAVSLYATAELEWVGRE